RRSRRAREHAAKGGRMIPLKVGTLEVVTPLMLIALLLLPLWWWIRRRRKPSAIIFSRVSVLASGPTAGRGVSRTLFVLRNVAIGMMVLALARPRSGAREENVTSSGINIMICFDISSS